MDNDNQNPISLSGTGTTSGTSQFMMTNQSLVWGSDVTVNSVSREKITIIQKIKVLGLTIKSKMFEISVDDFFNRIKADKLKLKIIDNIVDDYMISIERAKLLGQTALVEKLQDQLPVIQKEIEMVTVGVSEYLTTDQYDALKEKSSKHITMTKLHNFTGIIPDEVVEKAARVKEKNIFDEFVVVHYDPKKKSSDLTKAEKKKKEDPILFGRLNNSDKLYFIADWIDEYCNLTMSEAVKIIGEKQKSIINKKKK